MEPQTLLIGVAGFVLSFLVIYLISVFSMREKTFEEVLEEQRKRQEEEERKAKNERRAEKGERKKYRKFKEKPKEKSSPSPPRETQQPPAATNTKTVVPPVPEVPVVVETVTPTTAAPTEASVKAKSPKSSKKAQKPDTSDTNKLVDSSEKNEKPLVAKSSAPPVRKEDTVEEKNVRQLATQEKNTLNKSNNGKESKTAQKTSPPKQASPVPSTSPAQQQQKQQPPQQQKQQQPPQQQKQQPPQQQKQPKKQKQSPQQEQQPSPEQPEPPKQQKQQKQQKQPQQEQKQSKNTINESTNINGQAQQQNTKSKVELKSNTKTSKAAKQNANEALEKQTVNVEQKQKNASSGEENTIKKLSKKEKKAAAAAAAATPTPVAVTTATPVTLTPVENVIVATEEKPVKSQAPKEKKSKKAKSETETSGVTQLISSVKGTTLNDSEIQMLLDVLQSKQNKASQKETVADLLKQLEEKDKKILDVTDGAVKANQTVTELQQQIVNVEKQYDNKIKKLTNENKTLQSQAKKTHLEYEENIASLTNQMKNLESSTVSKEVYDKIVDEVHQLKSAPATPVIDPTEMASMKQKVQIMEKELSNNVLKLNNSEKKKKKFEDKIKEFEAKAKNENKRLEELNLALKNSNNEKALLTEESNKASEALKATQTECASLKSQLEVKELNNKETERNMMNLSKKVEELEEELAIVKQKNQVLLEENKLVHEKPVTVEVNLGERQEPAGAPNGDVQQESLACMKVALVDHEKLIGEKQSEIVRLTAELGNKETEAKARLDEKDSEIQALTTSLNIQVGEVEKLKEEIQVFKTKNDELRKKNWKAMEALENAEKSAVEKVNSAVKNAMDQCQSLDKSVLMRIFPDITVTEPLEQDLWLKTFEAEAIKYVKNLKEVSVSPVKLEKTEMVENELETRLSETEHKLSESEAKCISLNEELQRLTAQISETESVEELHKQIETLTTQLQDSKLKYTELQSNSDETKTELETTFNETKTLCMSLKEKLENASINNSTEENEKQLEALTDQLKESDENVSKLETQVKKYQDLLKVTDDKLQVLQRSVEDEEMKWRRERQTLQKSLSDTQKELEQLKQSQTNQTSTQSSENANSQVELEEKYKVLCLRAEENEKKVRDFSQTIVKLNGIIKTGQDALSQEQEFVRKLKQQLADKNSTGSQSATQEVEELKKKLAQKEKEVEQGQLHNNALSQKLASTVSSNDVGTSV